MTPFFAIVNKFQFLKQGGIAIYSLFKLVDSNWVIIIE